MRVCGHPLTYTGEGKAGEKRMMKLLWYWVPVYGLEIMATAQSLMASVVFCSNVQEDCVMLAR